MFDYNYILKLLNELNDELSGRDITGDLILYGGAVMCIQYNAREFTHDIDAYMKPKDQIEEIIKLMAFKHNLPEDWINDSVVKFASESEDIELYLKLSNLTIYTTSAKYLLALKIQSFRVGISSDEEDIIFLLRHLKITKVAEVISIIDKYFPTGYLNQRTQLALEYLIHEAL